jgi:hypothetical protein
MGNENITLLPTFIFERMGTFYLDVIENKVLNFPIKFHGLQVKNTDKAVGISDLKGYISTGLAAEGKGRQNPTKR